MTDGNQEAVVEVDSGVDGVFDEVEVNEVEAEEVEAKEAEAEKVEESEVEETEEEEETTASEQKSVPVAALKDERKKRQAAEDAAKTLREENEALKASKSEPVSDDKFSALVEVTTEFMREEHEDYPEKEKVFMDLIAKEGADGNLEITDLKLWEQYRAAKNPAKFAYNHAIKHQDYLDKTSPDYEKKLEERITAKVLADMKKRGLESAELPNLTSTAASQSNTDKPEKSTGDEGVWD